MPLNKETNPNQPFLHEQNVTKGQFLSFPSFPFP